jgi:hypothetical protein
MLSIESPAQMDERGIDAAGDRGQDDEQIVFAERMEALRRLSPVKARLLALIVDQMLAEARDRAGAKLGIALADGRLHG